jgi:uncharacterized damage-inducible protein DinB
MMYTSVPQIFATIDETRERIYERARGLNDEQFNARQNAGAWSVAEVVEHLTIIEGRLLGMMKLMLTKAEGATPKSDSASSEMQPFSLEHFVERASREKYSAPEHLHPSGKENPADLLARMQQTRDELHSLSPRIEATDLSMVVYPHPAFGPLNFYQWLAFIGIHEERHLAQIEKILAS